MPGFFLDSDTESSGADASADVDESAHIAAEFTRREADAYARGFEEAQQAVRAANEARMASALSALSESVASIQLHATRWTANTEENIAVIAIAVARHIVEREVTTDYTIVRDLVQRALTQFPIDQTITVHLHPDDAATCGNSAIAGGNGQMKDVRWLADPNIIRGGCLVEGRERIIDGRVDTSLERAYRSIGQVQA
jgi:flagellar biosynthesis/type III secretory pathway protein FliH